MTEVLAIALFVTICLTLVMGYPVAFVLGGRVAVICRAWHVCRRL